MAVGSPTPAQLHLNNLGAVVTQLHFFEFSLRHYLHLVDAPGGDFERWPLLKEGDIVPVNAMMNYDTLRQLIVGRSFAHLEEDLTVDRVTSYFAGLGVTLWPALLSQASGAHELARHRRS